jgi:3-hydroxyisobutyrate dehydrogenase-like beta-hydroxyacid dehydrogenase
VQTVGIIGLGLLGSALAERLLLSGRRVVGFDLSDSAGNSLERAGGLCVASAGEVFESAQIVLLSLPDATVVAGIIDEVASTLQAETLIIDTSTGDPWQTAATGERVAKAGASYLDATVAGSSAQVRQGDVVVMVGGTAEDFRRAEPLLATFARQSFHVGPCGAGARMKLVVNLVLGLNRAVLAEGLTLADALKLDPQKALDVLRSSAAYSAVMDTKGPKMLAQDFSPQARLSQHLKDVRLILEAGQRTGSSLPLSVLHRALLDALEAAGHGQLDNSAILLAFRHPPTE